MQENMRREFFLFKLYHLQLDYKEAAEGQAARAAAAAELRSAHEADVARASGSGAEVAACKKERNGAVRALDELRRKRDEQVRRGGPSLCTLRVCGASVRGGRARAESAAPASARGPRAAEPRARENQEEFGGPRREGHRHSGRAAGHRR